MKTKSIESIVEVESNPTTITKLNDGNFTIGYKTTQISKHSEQCFPLFNSEHEKEIICGQCCENS